MLKKVKIQFIALYNANRDDAVRAYVKCKNIETDESFTVIGFFVQKDEIWTKEENESCTLDFLTESLNNETELVVDTKPSKICSTLLEGLFITG